MTVLGQFSPLISTEFGVGFWDAEKNELRLSDGVLISPRIVFGFAASDSETRSYYETRAHRRATLCKYYAAPGDKGD